MSMPASPGRQRSPVTMSRAVGRERGAMSAEMVILGAVAVVALSLGSGAGMLVLADGRVSAAASAAARTASQQATPAQAASAAHETAQRTLAQAGTSCGLTVEVDTSQFRPGGRVDVLVRCRLDLAPVAIAGFAAHRDLTATAGAPLEHHRSFPGQR